MLARSQKPLLQGPYLAQRQTARLRWPGRFLFILCLLALLAGTWLLIVRPRLEGQVDGIGPAVRHVLQSQRSPYTPITRISPFMQHAIVSVEDRRFYQHHGIDLHGVVRAMVNDVRSRSLAEGGSTLTAQLVERTAALPANPALRALDVLGLAWVTEDEFSKQQILELYLNDVYFGRGAYGIAAAAQRYFHTTPDRLNVGQSAFLASLPQAPSYYGQYPYSTIAQGRRRTVIMDMAQQGYISPAQEQAALHARLAVVR